MIELPPFDGFMFVTYTMTHTAFRHVWVIMVNRIPVTALPCAALAMAAFFLWSVLRAMPGIAAVLSMWQ